MQQRLLLLLAILIGVSLLACKRKKPKKSSSLSAEYEVNFKPSSVQTDTNYGFVGEFVLENNWLNEASGLCVGRTNTSVLWSHNDSGDPSRIFAIGAHGEDYASIYLENIDHVDYEDICIGKLKQEKQHYLYLADIGDNANKRSHISIYRFAEPHVDTTLRGATVNIKREEINAYDIEFPDGARDAESIMFDPIDEAIYIVSKREKQVGVYRVWFETETTASLSLVAKLPLTWVVAADISEDGKHIAIKTGEDIWHWERQGTETLGKALQNAPKKLTYIKEKQGEAFAWGNNAKFYYTLGESSFFSASVLNCYAQYK